ncbi:MAG: DUF3467 domain-containing protein [Deltaproteobacteria bacterium]|jgi:hypothetical protein|nr:DUF3467 domain-containing protein [Deltaproteobacteria bacterium]
MENIKSEPQPVQINTGDELSRGRYSNTMLVTHGPEEFMMDWLLHSPNGAHLVSRVIVTPSHMKRIVRALQENLDKFEQNFGEIKITDSPTTMMQ